MNEKITFVMMKNIKIGFIVLFAASLTACSEYNEVLKGDDYQRKFEMANDYFDEGSDVKIKYRKSQKAIDKKGPVRKMKYGKTSLNRSIALYEQIYQKSPKAAEGELAYFRIGKAYYFNEDYYMAGYFLGMFPKRFEVSPKAEESLFLSSLCAVKNSPDYTLDQQETEIAINEMQNFIDRYPNSTLVDSCNRTIDRLKYKIEKKDFEAVQLYARTEQYRAAAAAAKAFNESYPRSKHLEESNYILVKNSYLLAKNSVDNKKRERYSDTMESYRTFVGLFSESKYLNELQGYSENAEKELKELK